MTSIYDIRGLIPGIDDYAYFQTSGLAPKPAPVMDEAIRWMRFQAPGPALPHIHGEILTRFESARATVADALGAEADEIVLTENTTVGINIVANGIDWLSGDNVVISNHEHPGNRIPWYNLKARYGVELRFLDFELDDDALLEQLEELLSTRTRVVAVSHVSRRTGRRLPVVALCEAAHRHGVPVLLDGAQAFGAIPVDVRAIGCDYYAFSGHKYILAPQGTGGLYVRRDRIERLAPSWIGSHSQKQLDDEGNMTLRDEACRFEFGTRNLADQIAFGRAVELWNEVGLPAVFAGIESYTDRLKTMLIEVPGITMRTPLPYRESSGIVTVRLAGTDSGELTRTLLSDHRILVSPLDRDPDSIRISAHVFNTDEEAERLVEALLKLRR